MRTNRTTKRQKTAVIYARARGDSLDEENQFIQAQLRACHNWAESRGYTIAKAYIDQGKGAYRNLEEREGLKDLLADSLSKQRSFDVIIYYSPSRLFRDLFEFETFRVRLEQEHVKLICVTDPMAATVRKSSSGRYQSPYRNLSLVGNTWKSRRVRDHQRNRSR
jgi:DNA invertase Pin-like site-specific DNA recombinase